MVGIAEISGAVAGLKGALDIVKGLNAVSDAVALNEAKIGLQSAIIDAQAGLLAAQEAQSTNLRRIDELEQEIVRLKDWTAERERYELADTGQGSVAFRLKEGMERGEPPHWICPNCYEKRQKAIMKHETLLPGQCKVLKCHPCGLEIVTSGVRLPPHAGGGPMPLVRR